MANVLKNKGASELIVKMYLNEDIADVHFEFNDGAQKVPASKNVLGTLSPVFYKMFYGSLKEGSAVKITDADAESFKEFLQFFYLEKVTLTMENIETVVRLADKYDILEAVSACASISQLKIDNMCWGYQLALFLNNEDLIDICEREIIETPTEIFATDEFKRCDKRTLDRILKLDLACKETDEFEACLSWAKHSCKKNGLDETKMENLKTQLGDSMKLIRFGAATIQEFSAFARSNYGLFTSDEIADVMFTLTSKDYESKEFNPKRRRLYQTPFEWNDGEALWCRRIKLNEKLTCVQSTEVVWFTSSQPVLLRAFATAPTINASYIDLSGRGVDIKISEIGDDSLNKVLYEGQSKTFDDNCVIATLTPLIMIQPQVKYEIQLTVPVTKTELARYCATWNPTVDLENGHTIQYHRCPSFTGYDTSSSGWIQSLAFNKV